MTPEKNAQRDNFVKLYQRFLALEAQDQSFDGEMEKHGEIGRARDAALYSAMLAPVTDVRSMMEKLSMFAAEMLREEEPKALLFIAALQSDLIMSR